MVHLKNSIPIFICGMFLLLSPPKTLAKAPYFHKSSGRGISNISKNRIVFKDQGGTTILERSDRKLGDQLYINSSGIILLRTINSKRFISQKRFLSGLTQNIDYIEENGRLRPLRGWITRSKVMNASEEVLNMANCSSRTDQFKSIRAVAAVITREKDAEDLGDAISENLFDESCPSVVKAKISKKFAEDLAIQSNGDGLLDCLDNPEKYAKSSISPEIKKDFTRIGTGFSTILADIDDGPSKNLIFSCREEKNSPVAMRFLENSPRAIQISLNDGKLPLPSDEKVPMLLYHELLHYSGVSEEQKVDAILKLCENSDGSALEELQKNTIQKDVRKKCPKGDPNCQFTPPWESNPKEDIKAAIANVDTSNLPGTEPLNAPPTNDTIARAYEPGPNQEGAIQEVAAGMANTFARVQSFSNAVMGAVIPNAVAGSPTSQVQGGNVRKTTYSSGTKLETIEEYSADPNANVVKIDFNSSKQSNQQAPNPSKEVAIKKQQPRMPGSEGTAVPYSEASADIASSGATRSGESSSSGQARKGKQSVNKTGQNTNSQNHQISLDEIRTFISGASADQVEAKLKDKQFTGNLQMLKIRITSDGKAYGSPSPSLKFIRDGNKFIPENQSP
ncbi:hypothetical protein [Bdellovibrio sp.]|uniref:hypothetical protein n=1 Tax=Bdellovibrio sp. TaxID=28201 RepID=UPI0039E21CFC